MSRTQFLTVALALVVSSASFAAEAPANPAALPEAAPAMLSPSSQVASPAAASPATEPAAKKTIVLGPQGVDDQGRVGRLHTVTRGDTLWDVSAAYLGTDLAGGAGDDQHLGLTAVRVPLRGHDRNVELGMRVSHYAAAAAVFSAFATAPSIVPTM